MKTLLIDTSCENLLVILLDGDNRIVKKVENISTHSTMLLPVINEITDLSDIDYFGVCVGPGSFTGIRIGVSTIKAFIYALNKKAVSVSSLEILSYTKDNKKVLPVIDAKHTFYVAKYDENKKVVLEPSCFTKEEVEKEKEFEVVTECNSLNVKPISIDEKVDGFIKAAKAKITNQEWDNTLEPVYILKSQAERDLEK